MKLIGLLLACGIVVVLWNNPAFQSYQEEIRRILPQDIPQSLKQRESGQTSDTATQTKVYKIRNQDGSWTYTNQVDDDTDAAETLTYRSDTNVTPAVEAAPSPPTSRTAGAPSQASTARPSTEDPITPLTPYTNPGRVMQLVEDAKNLQKTIDNRTRKIEESVNQQFQAKP